MSISAIEFVSPSEIPAEDALSLAVSEVLVEAWSEVADLDGDVISVLMSAPAGI
ncbi:MAG: hypothetical protein ACYDB2_07665 [Acidimicrobiales bacterium]